MKIHVSTNKDIYKWIDNLIWLGTVVLLTLICTTATNVYGKYILIAVAAVVFLLYIVKTGGRIHLRFTRFHGYWLAFGIYCFMSAFWAWNSSRAFAQGRTIIEVLLIVSLFYIFYQDETNVWKLYNAVKWSGFLAALYTIYVLGIGQLFTVLINGDRMQVGFANINTIGILAAFALLITMFEVFFRRFDLLSVLLCVPSLLVVFASGTRKALLIIGLGLIMILYYRYKHRNMLKNLLRYVGIAIIIVIVLNLLVAMPIMSGILERMSGLLAFVTGEGMADSSVLTRSEMIALGLKQFIKTPFFGIGMGNSNELLMRTYGWDSYLHNNFVELLCGGGIVGFVLYYAMYADFMYVFFKNRKTHDPVVILGLVMMALMLFMDAARVSYYSKPTVFYFMIFFLHADILRKKGAET